MLNQLLETIIQILTGWVDKFTSHAQHVEDKLDSLDQTASDIETNTEPISDIKDNTGAVITPIQNIKSNTDSIKQSSQTSTNNTTAILNNIRTLSTNTGRAAAYAQDCANNTLEIKDKVVTIASDTTQIRSNTNTVVTDMSKVYEALKWILVDKVITETEEGDNSVSFDTDLTNDLVSLEVSIEPTQTGSGTPSPSNPRAISGFDSGVVTRCGKNLFNKNAITLSSYIDIDGNIITVGATGWCISEYISVKGGYTYTASGLSRRGSGTYIALYDINKNVTRTIVIQANTNNTFTANEGEFYIRLSVRTAQSEYMTAQLEVGNTATTFEAYNGNTYTFAFGQTVYGGVLDVTRGKLHVTYGFIDLSSLSWGGGTYNIFEANINDMKSPQMPSERKSGIVCDSYPVSVGTSINNTMTDKSMLKNSTVLYIRNTDYSTASDFSNSLNGVYLAYELATPIEIQLTPSQITTIKGINTIITDGNISVTYDESVKHYLDKQDN